ncbi:MAG: M20/M25/M40 family metallo-hydrolase [Bacteroidota bacterium]
MSPTRRMTGIALFSAILGYALLSLYLYRPAPAQGRNISPQAFSASRAMDHLSPIAMIPHSSGTPAHEFVRQYLINTCRDMGLEVEEMNYSSGNVRPNFITAAFVKNLLVRLPGTASSKSILVMSHYDSQPNTPGAADDGAAVAAMLEAMRIIKEGPPLKNDVLFLFSDMEEGGLLGAAGFAERFPELGQVGLILNFEARGNSGPSMAFEVSSENGWLMRHFAEASPHPIANSLAYEVYQRMPNSTDFTIFKDKGYSGINFAFIEGYVNYHSMTDTPERLDKNSLQHHGEQLLALVQHFGQLDLMETKAPNVAFFNPLGAFLVVYPNHWDYGFVVLILGLFIFLLVRGLREKRFSIGSVLIALIAYLLVLLLTAGTAWGISYLVQKAYPHYQHFYNYNFYNTVYYWVGLCGWTITLFALAYRWLLRKWPEEALVLGALLLQLFLLAYLLTNMLSATYLLAIPLLFFLLGYLFLQYQTDERRYSERSAAVYALSLVMAIGIWVPSLYAFYIVFSLVFPLGAVLVLLLLLALLIPLLEWLRPDRFPWLVSLGLLLFLGGIIGGHLTSGISKEQPLQSNLSYFLDTDASKAYWLSSDQAENEVTGPLLQTASDEPFPMLFPRGSFWFTFRQAEAPLFEYKAPDYQILSDTLVNGQRQLQLLLTAKDATSLNIQFKDIRSIDQLIIDDIRYTQDQFKPQKGQFDLELNYTAPPTDGFQIGIVQNTPSPIELQLTSRTMGLPESITFQEDIIPSAGYFSNVVFVKKDVFLESN